jgi:hypothetical protein
MANTQAMCASFKKELLGGIHAFGTTVARAGTTADAFKAALYLTTAAIDATATVYTIAGEVSDASYTAGGVAIASWTAPNVSPGGTPASQSNAFTQPSASIVYTALTSASAFNAVLIYNSTQGNKAVSVHTFGSQTITAGTLTLTMPTPGATTSLLQLN